MPIYEYACGKCEREFEVEQRITDDPVKTCPHCRSRKVKRLISQTSFVLKGGGWHSDLYSSKRGDSKKEAPAEGASAAASSDSGSSDSGSDSKSSKSKSDSPSSKEAKKGKKGAKAAA